eukprot:356189-Chlamydomonas_euryale.AAC.2
MHAGAGGSGGRGRGGSGWSGEGGSSDVLQVGRKGLCCGGPPQSSCGATSVVQRDGGPSPGPECCSPPSGLHAALLSSPALFCLGLLRCHFLVELRRPLNPSYLLSTLRRACSPNHCASARAPACDHSPPPRPACLRSPPRPACNRSPPKPPVLWAASLPPCPDPAPNYFPTCSQPVPNLAAVTTAHAGLRCRTRGRAHRSSCRT